MDKQKKQRFLQRLVEGLLSIVLVLIFFFVLIMVFNAIFPEGSGLHFIFDDQASDEPAGRREQTDIQLSRGDATDLLLADASWAAHLIKTRNLVKSKKSDAIAWQNAREGMTLHNLDAVQTLDDSTALIRFDAKNQVELGENSLIVIRRMEKDLLFKEKRSFMVVVDGELRGQLGGGDDSGVYLEVTTPNAVARLQSRPDDQEGIEFKIDVLEDAASSVTIYSGSGEVEAQGETVTLDRNQLTRIEGESAPSQPVTLPDPVTLQTPDDGTVFPYRSLPPRVRMAWQEQGQGTSYHFLLATDRAFTDLLIDRKLDQAWFVHGNLRAGAYFWKVSSINDNGEGRFGQTRQFRLQQDQIAPLLEVQFPAEIVRKESVEVSGVTEPGVRLYVAGAAVTLEPDGTFRHDLLLKPGINVVVVEAVDGAGNISYQSQMINGEY